MASRPSMTCMERAERHKRIVAEYANGKPPRVLARLYSVSATHVKRIVNLYGVSRPVGRPSSNDNQFNNEKGGASASPGSFTVLQQRDRSLFKKARPCPFCGGEFLYWSLGAVTCDECQASGPFVGHPTLEKPIEELAPEGVRLWNGAPR